MAHPGNEGPKLRRIRESLGISPTRYWQRLNALLDDPAALAIDPVTVNRLRRLRDQRRARHEDARAARRELARGAR